MNASERVPKQQQTAAARYALTDLDIHHQPTTHTGRELMEEGLAVNIPDQPGAVVLTYKKLN